ncbi:hypothetical protein K458DRAFT_462460 [Lentithecium fluviatile CBS 122367]|uniref:DUF7587 domain-containing protein n=1 Tax=Lentithecium fluviatile CBS 122367 TaxID=1168545 RepID=A0A6G1JGZ5_9PLEO|nr:hypothetical protein K458DRAFT_462460 [Lentithecium fluviatile CBS 122367]
MSTPYSFSGPQLEPPSPTLSCYSTQANTEPPTPDSIPPFVYRAHRTGARTTYHFSAGFASKNQNTVMYTSDNLLRFGMAHLNRQTNISSPFISVYDSYTQAEAVAKHFAEKYHENTWVVTVDTRQFARGPVFRAADLMNMEGASDAGNRNGSAEENAWLHHGEYLVTYRIPAQAIREEVQVGRIADQRWRAPGAGVVGDTCGMGVQRV